MKINLGIWKCESLKFSDFRKKCHNDEDEFRELELELELENFPV